MTIIPFDRKTAKPGDRIILKTCRKIPIVFRGRGFGADVIVEFTGAEGNKFDRILTPSQQLMLEVEK